MLHQCYEDLDFIQFLTISRKTRTRRRTENYEDKRIYQELSISNEF